MSKELVSKNRFNSDKLCELDRKPKNKVRNKHRTSQIDPVFNTKYKKPIRSLGDIDDEHEGVGR